MLDTNVLVPPGLRRDLQQAAQLGACTAIWSPWIVAELNRVLTWRWIRDVTHGDLSRANERLCAQASKSMMQILLATFELVNPWRLWGMWYPVATMQILLATFELVNPRPPFPRAWISLQDAWDHPIWACAVAGDADYVVSDNHHDYPPADAHGRHRFLGIEYLSGAEFLRRLVTGEL